MTHKHLFLGTRRSSSSRSSGGAGGGCSGRRRPWHPVEARPRAPAVLHLPKVASELSTDESRCCGRHRCSRSPPARARRCPKPHRRWRPSAAALRCSVRGSAGPVTPVKRSRGRAGGQRATAGGSMEGVLGTDTRSPRHPPRMPAGCGNESRTPVSLFGRARRTPAATAMTGSGPGAVRALPAPHRRPHP